MGMASHLNDTEWSEQAGMLLNFRDKKVAELRSDDITLKRIIIERRIKKAAKQHLQNESAFARGRLDKVSAEYLKSMCMDYDELKTAGVAYKHETDMRDEELETERMSDKERSETPDRQETTMDILITKELSSDKPNDTVMQNPREQYLLENALKNTELVKSMLDSEAALQNPRKHSISESDEYDVLGNDYGTSNNTNVRPTEVSTSFPSHAINAQNSVDYQNFAFNSHGGMAVYQPNAPFNLTQSNPPINAIPTTTTGIKKTRSGTLSPRKSQSAQQPQAGSRNKAPKALRRMEHVARKHGL
ncbi:LANO_0H05358g1_1 [Lachancea nothofagi CBS 11611]|uniref:LANO_0H05358g1_1 n=1 Tax=Lachancea nothofagi CBS 11611 TaxID=1266666 RepID=A0A1G4KL95_9SACH|nr:LANO_0H05358g1_1 [Lachancea nothofagi CBS 11611]